MPRFHRARVLELEVRGAAVATAEAFPAVVAPPVVAEEAVVVVAGSLCCAECIRRGRASLVNLGGTI